MIRIRTTLYTNELLAESKIKTVYNRNDYEEAYHKKLRAFARKPSLNAKNATVTTGIEHTHSHARGVRAFAVAIAACKMPVNIRT